MDVFVSTYPFGADDPQPRKLLDDSNFNVSYNEFSRKLTVDELIERAGKTRVLLAGTENLMPFLEQNPNLEMISIKKSRQEFNLAVGIILFRANLGRLPHRHFLVYKTIDD